MIVPYCFILIFLVPFVLYERKLLFIVCREQSPKQCSLWNFVLSPCKIFLHFISLFVFLFFTLFRDIALFVELLHILQCVTCYMFFFTSFSFSSFSDCFYGYDADRRSSRNLAQGSALGRELQGTDALKEQGEALVTYLQLILFIIKRWSIEPVHRELNVILLLDIKNHCRDIFGHGVGELVDTTPL